MPTPVITLGESKLTPSIVTTVEPALPTVGVNRLMTGTLVTSKLFELVTEPPPVVMEIFPVVPDAGTWALIRVGAGAEKAGEATPLNLTEATLVKFTPRISTKLRGGPTRGEKSSMIGAGPGDDEVEDRCRHTRGRDDGDRTVGRAEVGTVARICVEAVMANAVTANVEVRLLNRHIAVAPSKIESSDGDRDICRAAQRRKIPDARCHQKTASALPGLPVGVVTWIGPLIPVRRGRPQSVSVVRRQNEVRRHGIEEDDRRWSRSPDPITVTWVPGYPSVGERVVTTGAANTDVATHHNAQNQTTRARSNHHACWESYHGSARCRKSFVKAETRNQNRFEMSTASTGE